MSEFPDEHDAGSVKYETENSYDIIGFTEYRTICDQADNFRKVGIQDEKSYLKIIQDQRTVFTDYGDRTTPLLAPIEYEKMYDYEGCAELTSKSNIMLLSIPIGLALGQGEVQPITIDPDTAIIVEEFVPPSDNSELPVEHHIPSFINNPHVRTMDFKHPDLASLPANENAWMAAYIFEFGPSPELTMPFNEDNFKPLVAKVWEDYCRDHNQAETPHEDADGTFFLFADQLAEMPDVVDKMWAISQTGFGKVLGAHHPVSMEFNREFFNQQTAADNTVTAIHYVNGEPVCFGFIGLDMNNNDWLNCNSTVMAKEQDEAEKAQRAYVHFHELISNGYEGMGYSTNILKTFLDIAARTRYNYSVFFESTNLSSTYIPAIVEKEVARIDDIVVKRDIEMLGKLSYWAILEDD